MFCQAPLPRVVSLRTAVVVMVFTTVFVAGFSLLPIGTTEVNAALPFFTTCSPPCEEKFDSFTMLPTGWTATLATGQAGDLPWRTVTTDRVSFPNSVFAAGPSHVSDNWLTSKTFFGISSDAVLSFSRKNQLETSFDGMVLEVSIDNGPFVDIVTAGGSFTAGGYNAILASTSPISGRFAWTGDTVGFVTTSVSLKSSGTSRSFTFRWRVVSDFSVASTGAFIDNVTLTEVPANDNFSNALPLLGVSGVVFGSNVAATKEPFEQNIAGTAGSGSVWYQWQAPTTGRYVFTTYGSTVNTLLAVYTGSNVQGTQVAGNDDDGIMCFEAMRQSRVAFNTVAGVIYHIAVDGKFDNGDIKLRWGRSATINVRPTTVSSTPGGGSEGSRLDGDICTVSNFIFTFGDIPTGGSYSVSIKAPFGYSYSPANGNPSTSPLTGDVTLTYYLRTPAYAITGRITNLPSTDMTGVTVMCVSNNGGVVSQPATIAILSPYVVFECRGLPANAEYLVTPSKLGYEFQPATKLVQLFGNIDIGLVPATASSHTISGRVTQPNGTAGVSGVTVALSGSQTASTSTGSNGNYSFTVLHGGNYSLTPSNSNSTFTPLSRSFSNVTVDQTGDFTAAFILQLILDDTGQAAAVDSMLHTRDPFPVKNTSALNHGVVRNTRVAIFLSNFQLGAGELPSSVVINLVGSNSQTYDLPAEDVRVTPNPAFTQVIFRLPDTLSPGTCTLFVKARGLTSNIGAFRIKP